VEFLLVAPLAPLVCIESVCGPSQSIRGRVIYHGPRRRCVAIAAPMVVSGHPSTMAPTCPRPLVPRGPMEAIAAL